MNADDTDIDPSEEAKGSNPRVLLRFVDDAFDSFKREGGAFSAGECEQRWEQADHRREKVREAIQELARLRGVATTAERGRPGGKSRVPRTLESVVVDATKARASLLEVCRLLGVPPLRPGAPLSQIAQHLASHARRA